MLRHFDTNTQLSRNCSTPHSFLRLEQRNKTNLLQRVGIEHTTVAFNHTVMLRHDGLKRINYLTYLTLLHYIQTGFQAIKAGELPHPHISQHRSWIATEDLHKWHIQVEILRKSTRFVNLCMYVCIIVSIMGTWIIFLINLASLL